MKLKANSIFKKPGKYHGKNKSKNTPYFKIHDTTNILGIPLIKMVAELKIIYRKWTWQYFLKKWHEVCVNYLETRVAVEMV